jgi:hypothetical protein
MYNETKNIPEPSTVNVRLLESWEAAMFGMGVVELVIVRPEVEGSYDRSRKLKRKFSFPRPM